MDINTFNGEYDNLTLERKREGLRNLFQILSDKPQNFQGLIEEILHLCTLSEDDDEFGTEGADI